MNPRALFFAAVFAGAACTPSTKPEDAASAASSSKPRAPYAATRQCFPSKTECEAKRASVEKTGVLPKSIFSEFPFLREPVAPGAAPAGLTNDMTQFHWTTANKECDEQVSAFPSLEAPAAAPTAAPTAATPIPKGRRKPAAQTTSLFCFQTQGEPKGKPAPSARE